MSLNARRFYLVTGFHRSGTSLLAQTLHANGMHMGNELMGATFSNPLGHVEDMPVVRLHDKIYHLNGADWRYHDSSPLIKPVWLSNYIESYIQSRDASPCKNSRSDSSAYNVNAVVNGIKDPRAVHFLKDWQVAGGKKVKFIFIYRDWRTSAHSLLKRQSRHIINSAHPIDKHVVNLSFWLQPTLAYDMWLSANKRICDFVAANRSDCLLISQESLVAGASVSLSVLDTLELPKDIFNLSTYDPNMLSQSAPIVAERMLSSELLHQLDSCYDELQTLANLPFDTTSLNSKISHVDSARSAVLPKNVMKPDKAKLNKGLNIFENASFNFSELTWAELSGALIRIPLARYSYSHYIEVLSREDGTPEDYFGLAKVAHKQGQWVVTRVLKIRACIADTKEMSMSMFDMKRWHTYMNADSEWLRCPDQDLPNPNPFSLRDKSQLLERFNGHDELLAQSIDVVCSTESERSDELLALYFSFILLTQALPEHAYLKIARVAEKRVLFDVWEFACFKCIRASYISDIDDMRGNAFSRLRRLYKALSNQRLYDVVDAYFSQESIVNESGVSSSGLSEGQKHKPLRHRFAILPHNLDYKKILAIGYEDSVLGSQLDRLNSRLCFLAKDNEAWLAKGLGNLHTNAARECLRYYVTSHWSKLWPKKLSDFIFNERLAATTQLDFINAQDTQFGSLESEQWLCIYDFEPQAFIALMSLLADKCPLFHCVILVNNAQKLRYQSELSICVKNGISVRTITGAGLPSVLGGVNECLVSYDGIVKKPAWFGFIHCRYQNTSLSKQALLLCWYSMLGGEQSFPELYAGNRQLPTKSSDNDKPEMRLPSYAPWMLNEIQDKPFYYPIDHMFWLNASAYVFALERTEVIPHRWLLKLINELKAYERSISFVHQRFLFPFE